MISLLIMPVILGIFAGLYLAGFGMRYISDPYDRVAFYLTVLASDVIIVVLAYLLFLPTVEMVLFTLTFTQCMTWFIMDKKTMVHYQHYEE